MNLIDYFEPSQTLPLSIGLPKSASVFGKIQILGISKNIEIDSNTLVVFGVNESRNSSNPSASKGADAIRQYLYSLSGAIIKKPLVDLGNLKATADPSDTYMAVRDVAAYLISKGAVCLVLGGTQELSWPLYLATLESHNPVTVTLIDHTIDMGSNDGDFSSTCYIDKFLTEAEGTLFSLNVLGYQGYLTNSNHIKEFSDRNFELSRLGYVRGAMSEIEPTLRGSNIVSLDIGSVKQSDSPGAINPSPNGLYSEEACQLARYSGVSSSAVVFGVFELNTDADLRGQSSHLAAQIAWHFIDGFSERFKYPNIDENHSIIKRFYVKSPIPNIELIFLQNTYNDNWWIELPGTKKTGNNPTVIACSFSDYQKASKGDVPERWMRAWRRIT